MSVKEKQHSVYKGFFSAKLSEESVILLQKGDLEAFRQCYDAYHRAIYNLAYRMSQQKSIAEDISQEVLLEVYAKSKTLKKSYLIGAWIRRITVNKTLNWLTKASYRNEKSIDECNSAKQYHDSASNSYEAYADKNAQPPSVKCEHLDLAQFYLSQLSERSRLILWLYVVEGYSHQEIADFFDKTVSFSKSIVARSLAQIRNANIELRDEWNEKEAIKNNARLSETKFLAKSFKALGVLAID